MFKNKKKKKQLMRNVNISVCNSQIPWHVIKINQSA